MTMPFYVAPEQQMKDRADFARKGIARGRSVVALRYADGLAFVAENPSSTLHKVSEIYDRIAFAGVGRYNEFEALRVAGIQQADLRGYTYDRADVTARGLVNNYAQVLGGAFGSAHDKPLEVELVVGELGPDPSADRLYRLGFDGSVTDEPAFAVIGGSASSLAGVVRDGFDPAAPLAQALRLAASALSDAAGHRLDVHELEVGVLDRTRPGRRLFARLTRERVAEAVRPA